TKNPGPVNAASFLQKEGVPGTTMLRWTSGSDTWPALLRHAESASARAMFLNLLTSPASKILDQTNLFISHYNFIRLQLFILLTISMQISTFGRCGARRPHTPRWAVPLQSRITWNVFSN